MRRNPRRAYDGQWNKIPPMTPWHHARTASARSTPSARRTAAGIRRPPRTSTSPLSPSAQFSAKGVSYYDVPAEYNVKTISRT